MAQRQSQNQKQGFTLVELLVVIAIIGILAALLLPVLTKAQGRAKRVWCENDLRQMGIAFHTFSHDHNSQFPMTVPMIDGGSQELTLNGYLINGPFYFGYRHFQTLSNLLVTPKILACPTDTAREEAANFGGLQNSNVSYFVGVTADYNKPNTILAGDANLVISNPASPTLLRYLTGYQMEWTRGQQHITGGNVLFSDAHAEEWANAQGHTLLNDEDFVLPTIRPFGVSISSSPIGSSSPGGGGSGAGSSPPSFPSSPSSPPSSPSGGTPSSPSQPSQPSQPQQPGSPSMPASSTPTHTNSGVVGSPATPGKPPMPSASTANHAPNLGAPMVDGQTYDQPTVPSTPHTAPAMVDASNIPAVVTVPETNPPPAPPEKAVKMQKFAGWLFLILMLLLLFLIFIAFQMWRKAQEAEAKKPRR